MPAAADPDIAAIFRRPFDEQVAFFRGKLGKLVPTATWRDLLRAEHDRAFMVAGAAKADLLADLAWAVDTAIADGESLDKFRKRFAAIVQRHGWQGWTGSDTEAGRAWRTRVIYQTNLQTSYAAGRLVQLQNFPLWVYRHGGSRDPRPQHLAWNGLALPAGHPFWKTHYPPSAWGCTCYVLGARNAAGAQRLGATPGYTAPPEGWDVRDARGNLPGVDAGWDYQPGHTVADTVRAMVRKIVNLPPEIGASLGNEMPLEDLSEPFSSWANAITTPRGALFPVGALSRKVIEQLAARGIKPSSAGLIVRDEDVLHTHRDTKSDALPWDWYLALPRHLTAPRAVLLDKTDPSGALLMVFDVQGQTAKLVVKVDYAITERGADGIKRRRKANIVRTGKMMDAKALADAASYAVLEGGL